MKRVVALWLISILVGSTLIIGGSSPAEAANSNYSATLANLWANEAVEKPDLVNNKIGLDFSMHFADFVVIDGTIWAYYIKADTNGKLGVGLAKSTDSINFTDHGIVLTVGSSGSWDDVYASFPGIWYDNGTFYLVYEGAGTGTDGDIGLATSTNGTSFTKQGRILYHNTTGWESINIGTPDLYKSGSTWYLT